MKKLLKHYCKNLVAMLILAGVGFIIINHLWLTVGALPIAITCFELKKEKYSKTEKWITGKQK